MSGSWTGRRNAFAIMDSLVMSLIRDEPGMNVQTMPRKVEND